MTRCAVKEILRQIYLNKVRKSRLQIDNSKKGMQSALPLLTKEEIVSINAVWGQITKKINLKQHRLYKKINGHINPDYLTDDVYIPYIERSLNDFAQMFFASNKSMYPIWYKELNQPVCYIRKINGNIFFKENRVKNIDTAIENLIQSEIEDIIVKKSTDSYGGLDVVKINLIGINKDEKYNIVQSAINKIEGDFIIQQAIHQTPDTAVFNKDSLNTIRITSLNINNKTSICFSQFRTGQKGAYVDNLVSGGMMINIDKNGDLGENGINGQKELVPIQGHYNIKSYTKIVQLVEKYHSILFPNFGLIGWDWAIDDEENPVFIEANLWYPTIEGQMISGPVFGDRTQEVIDYFKNLKKPIYYIPI